MQTADSTIMLLITVRLICVIIRAAELTASVLKSNSGLNMAYADSYNRIAA